MADASPRSGRVHRNVAVEPRRLGQNLRMAGATGCSILPGHIAAARGDGLTRDWQQLVVADDRLKGVIPDDPHAGLQTASDFRSYPDPLPRNP